MNLLLKYLHLLSANSEILKNYLNIYLIMPISDQNFDSKIIEIALDGIT